MQIKVNKGYLREFNESLTQATLQLQHLNYYFIFSNKSFFINLIFHCEQCLSGSAFFLSQQQESVLVFCGECFVLCCQQSLAVQRERDQFNFCWSRKLFGPKKWCYIFPFPTILMIKPFSSNPVLNHSIGLISPRRFEVLQQMWRRGRRENYRNISLTARPAAAVTQRQANASFCLLSSSIYFCWRCWKL